MIRKFCSQGRAELSGEPGIKNYREGLMAREDAVKCGVVPMSRSSIRFSQTRADMPGKRDLRHARHRV